MINVDLHTCASDNLKFFQAAWAEVMFFYAKRAVHAMPEEDKVQWATAVGFTMLQVPDVMQKCSLGPAEQTALEDAIKGLAEGGAGISFDYTAPQGSTVSKDMLENHMAITVKDWAKMKWKDFGIDLGHLLQEMAVTVYSQKYTVDDRGVLRRRSCRSRSPALASSMAFKLDADFLPGPERVAPHVMDQNWKKMVDREELFVLGELRHGRSHRVNPITWELPMSSRGGTGSTSRGADILSLEVPRSQMTTGRSQGSRSGVSRSGVSNRLSTAGSLMSAARSQTTSYLSQELKMERQQREAAEAEVAALRKQLNDKAGKSKTSRRKSHEPVQEEPGC